MLKGIKVVEFQGLAPSVFCGMYFADQGAQVILVARPQPVPFSMQIDTNIMNRNKKCIALSLKDRDDKKVIHELIKSSDIIIDPFRPGVLQKQGLGPQELYQINPNVILLRVTGYGQFGSMALKPGHDLNYISSSGILKLINPQKNTLQFPANYLADFISASLGIMGTLQALSTRKIKGHGSVVDCSLAGGCSYLTQIVNTNHKNLNQTQHKLIQYFELKGRRYVTTKYLMSNEIQNTQIQTQIENMQMKNQFFVRKEHYEIAQIKKIDKIKNSRLGNPFGVQEKQGFGKIPERDLNRQQILHKLELMKMMTRPKL